jgi:bifunctional DNA-binding transcriptional regulator/antitoxin component of YhaV-PrlF toxin-antitoxin module
MKATGIERRIDDLRRIVIPKEIRRTMRLRDGAPSLKTLTQDLVFCMSVESAAERYIGK